MSELEQSLDAIIASDRAKKASHTVSRKRRAPSGRVGKSNRTRSNAAAKKAAAAAIAAAALKKANKSKGRNSGRVVSPTVDASSLEMATKVVVSGLPTDIKPLNVKEFFQSQIGGVSHVSLSYNERGQSTGVATVIFKHASTARKAVAKYNNAPIDGKRKTLKLELVVDPEQKSLAARITPNVVVDSSAVRARLQFKRNRRNQQVVRSNNRGRRSNSGNNNGNNNGNKNGNGNGNNNGNNNKGRKGGRSRRQKKTVAELDQEMADYFAEGKQLDRL